VPYAVAALDVEIGRCQRRLESAQRSRERADSERKWATADKAIRLESRKFDELNRLRGELLGARRG
jgi:hypothetical protein